MISTLSDITEIALVAQAEASGCARSDAPAAARAKFRYADPVTWSALQAVDRALACAPPGALGTRERTGVIFMSSSGPAESIAAIVASAREGYVSPLRFAAVTPASVAGAICIVHEFRGPSLTLTTPIAASLPVSEALARGWLTRGVLDLVVLLTSEMSETVPITRCALWARRSPTLFDDHEVLAAAP